MAGTIPDVRKNADPDILFDLTPEDDKVLTESELISLVNYGQKQSSVKVLGVEGVVHNIQLALLWDEDYVDVLKRTTKYATDPVLRVKVIRRLRLHKAIQTVDSLDYSDALDVKAQRNLWNMLCRMTESQIEYLDGKYSEIELERNMSMAEDIKSIDDTLSDTSPDSLKEFSTEEVPQESEAPVDETAIPEADETLPEENLTPDTKPFGENPHAAFIAEQLATQTADIKEVEKKIGVSSMEELPQEKAVNSPKQTGAEDVQS